MAEMVQGPPCRNCGGTERYAKVAKGRKFARCASCCRDATQRWRSAPENAEANRKASRHLAMKNRERQREVLRRWQKKNPERAVAHTLRRKFRKLRTMPDWLTQVQHDETAAIYEEARQISRETSVEHHVDHIVPLEGEEGSMRASRALEPPGPARKGEPEEGQ